MPQEDLITVATYNSYIEAELARGVLDDAGIRAVIVGDNARNVFAGVEVIEEVELQVLEHDAEQAAEVLADRPQEE